MVPVFHLGLPVHSCVVCNCTQVFFKRRTLSTARQLVRWGAITVITQKENSTINEKDDEIKKCQKCSFTVFAYQQITGHSELNILIPRLSATPRPVPAGCPATMATRLHGCRHGSPMCVISSEAARVALQCFKGKERAEK